MNGRRITGLVIVAAVVLLSLYDAAIAWTCGEPSTISRVVLTWAYRWPIIPFAVGVLCGHLFASQHEGVTR